jgi:hypothetical protein
MIKEILKDKALRICDQCGHEQWVNRWNLSRVGIHICRYCSCRNTAKTRVTKAWNKGLKQEPKKVGNSYIDQSGYVNVWVGKHQNPDTVSGYEKEHRILYELFLGRKLQPTEVLHHIDSDKTNNIPSNLHLCSGHADHKRTHSQLERVSMQLVKLGVIKFDDIIGEYYIDPYISDIVSELGELLETPEKDNQQRSFSEMTEEERSTTIQKWSTLKRVEAPNNSSS